MPYTVAWNEAIPSTTSAANLIWQFIQNDKIAVRERLDDLFGTSGLTSFANADPYRVNQLRMGATAISKIIPGSTRLDLMASNDSDVNLRILDNGNSEFRGTMKISKRAAGVVNTLTSATTVDVDLELANVYKITLAHNVTFTFSNPTAGQFFVLELTQDATGSRTVTWPASVEWSAGVAPSITTTVGRTDVVSMYYNGTKYIAVLVGQNFDLS